MNSNQSTNPGMHLRYPIVIYPSPEGGFVAEAPELRGCLAQGDTEIECLEEMERVMQIWLQTADANSIPSPDTSRFLEHLRQAVNA